MARPQHLILAAWLEALLGNMAYSLDAVSVWVAYKRSTERGHNCVVKRASEFQVWHGDGHMIEKVHRAANRKPVPSVEPYASKKMGPSRVSVPLIR